MPRLLALCDGDDIEPTVFSGCAPFSQRPVQPAGQAFFDRFERRAGSEEHEPKDASGSDEEHEGSEPGSQPSPSRSSPGAKKKDKKKIGDEALKLPECLKNEDLYSLLEVDDGASQDDLKKAFRKICLTQHPDKAGAGKSEDEMEAVNQHFVKLQEAFNVLSDLKKRRKYDSMGEFDDWVPTKLKDGQDFFVVFDEVFKRNAKWSENKPVPELGGKDTPYAKVKIFYDFWFGFESWRNLDEQIMEECGEDCFQDLDEAESRDEKRWMERENTRIRSKFQKIERQRIFGFVELAEKLDPRVKAEKDKQHAAREAAKAAKEAKRIESERLAREEEARKAAEEELARIARAEEKAIREGEKQVKKVARAKLRKVVKDLNLGLADDFLQEFLLALDASETDRLTGEIESGASGAKGEAVFAAMKAKGVEPVIIKEDEKSTEEGSPSDDEPVDPKEVARREKERLKKLRQQEERQKVEDAKNKKLREEEAEKRAEEKAVRDVKKKAEQEKKDKEQQKASKKETERLKREEEKRARDEAKLVEQAEKSKEASKKQSEEQRQRQKEENEAEQAEKLLELRTFEYERDRLFRCEAFEKLAWPAVIEAAQAASENPIIASGLAAAAAEHEDEEDLLDAQLACLGSFFVFGIRPAEDALALSSGLRSKVKKLRNKIRSAAVAGDFALEAPAGTVADPEALEQLLRASRGEAPPPAAAEAVAAEAASAEPVKTGKKKGKAKAAPADEDLDALLQEFGLDVSDKKPKKSGKKK